MSDPADKSDDLIAELAKLMATSPQGNDPAARPVLKSAPLDPNATVPQVPSPQPPAAPTPFRIPGMDAPVAAAPRPSIAPAQSAPMAPAPENRAPATGSIRIPGMDQPAPVSTSAPVSKFDFGKPVAPAAIKQEPLSSLADRIAARNDSDLRTRSEPAFAPSPAPAPIRFPSDLKPVSENKSFGQGPALSVAPSAPPAGNSDFHFDFGLNQPPAEPPVAHEAQSDPIADLINAEMASEPEPAPAPQPQQRAPQAVVTPVLRTASPMQSAPKPAMAPMSSAAPRPVSNAPIPLKPVSVAPRSPEADRFAISPGVGLNIKPMASQPLSPPQPRAPQPAPVAYDSDPMSEIESLIGEAVRVELAPGPVRVQTPQQVQPKVHLESEADLEQEIGYHPQQSTPAPVVPPLTTQFAPRRSSLKDDASHASAEDAILAAAAATGARVDRVEPSVGEESPYRRLKVKPQRSSFLSGGMRQYVGMAVAGTLLLAAGLGLYWVLNMGRTSSTAGTNAPQLTADATPVKVKPAAATKPVTDSAKSPVLAKMDGASQAPSSEQLVSTDETSGDAVTRDVTAAPDTGESGLANRKVRTVTVRPDGTIVSGDDAVAGTQELPIDRPNVPAVPSTETTNLLGNDTPTDATDPAAATPLIPTASVPPTAADATTTVADAQPTIDPTIVAPTPMSFPVHSATPALAFDTPPKNSSVNAVITGAQTPNGQIDLLGGTTTTPKPTPTKPVQLAPQEANLAPPAAAGAGNAAAYVQISSMPSQAEADAQVRSVTAKYGSLFGGNKLVVQQADLGQKGIRYRVRLPAASLADANNICAQIKAQGGDCFATNG